MTFNGSLEHLQALVGQLAIPCHWEHKGSFELCVFDADRSNLKLNWWPVRSALQLVGDPEVRIGVQAKLEALLNS